MIFMLKMNDTDAVAYVTGPDGVDVDELFLQFQREWPQASSPRPLRGQLMAQGMSLLDAIAEQRQQYQTIREALPPPSQWAHYDHPRASFPTWLAQQPGWTLVGVQSPELAYIFIDVPQP
jgi:hypothetical protein